MQQKNKDAITWVATGILIMMICSLVMFHFVKKSVIRGCLNTNLVTINDVKLECRLNTSQFKGEIVNDSIVKKNLTILESDAINDSTIIKPKSITITIDGK